MVTAITFLFHGGAQLLPSSGSGEAGAPDAITGVSGVYKNDDGQDRV